MKTFVILLLSALSVHGWNSLRKMPTCLPGKVFSNKCTICTCSLDAKTISCSKKECDDWIENGKLLCKPGKTYKQNCNTCTCDKDGRSTTCILMDCTNSVTEPSQETNVSQTTEGTTEGTTTPKIICTPGSIFKNKCNTCHCSLDGTSAACTTLACPPEEGTTKEPIQETTVSNSTEGTTQGTTTPKIICTPGSIFKNNCNTCHCSLDGTSAACTLMACPPEEGTTKEPIQETTVSNSTEGTTQGTTTPKIICTPGSTFKNKCNICHCSLDGTSAACTRMACPPEEGTTKGPIQETTVSKATEGTTTPKRICIPGSTFKNKCNTCRCSWDGTTAACTLMACPPEEGTTEGPIQETTVSKATEGTTQETTTSKSISSPVTEPTQEVTTKKRICLPNTSFKVQCNDCICSRDGTSMACTDKACPEWTTGYVTTTPKIICVPGSVFKIKCNICGCSPDGTSQICTKQACPEIDPETTTKKQICVPGSTFKIECNTCGCSSDGTSVACTKMACPENKDKCKPGKVYTNKCNICICRNDGKSKVCTAMKCPRNKSCKSDTSNSSRSSDSSESSESKSDDSSESSETDSSESSESKDNSNDSSGSSEENKKSSKERRFCKPCKHFRQGCNQCVCNKDGNSAICSLKSCEKNNRSESCKEEIKGGITCKPRRIFKSKCNTCICGKNGKSAVCTLRSCSE